MPTDLDDLGSGSTGGSTTATAPPSPTPRGNAASPNRLAGLGVGGFTPTTDGGTRTTEFILNETAGEPIPSGVEFGQARDHDELARPVVVAGEAATIEATPAQLQAAESGEESAMGDLSAIEGFVPPRPASEAAESDGVLVDAGAGMGMGQQEFLPIAAIAASVVSTIGPKVAKAALKKLSPHADRVIRRLPGPLGSITRRALKPVGGVSGLASLAASLFEMAEQESADDDTAVDEAQVDQVVSLIEAIVDIDDRVRVRNTTQVPWMRLCALRITFPSGGSFRGTGFFIGPRAVATAGHCVYMQSQGGWARRVEVIPGCDGTTQPFGKVESANLRSVGGWVNEKKPECDYGCILLPSGAFGGRNLGSFGAAAFDNAKLLAQPAVIAGYPGDKPFAELWGAARQLKAVTPKTLQYNTATMGGQSGAPVYIIRDGQRYVVGIHNYGSSVGNTATRVTPEVLTRLIAWSRM